MSTTSPREAPTTLDGATMPILSGFYPDPSICRVGEDYYLVASSFELFPGVPIWHSRDLVSWTQIGNVLDRPSQLDLTRSGAGSDGVYAPTIRHHGGRFWMTTTVTNSFERGPLIVSAEDPAGPWTDPVYVEGLVGIDSDLYWDDDDTCRMTLSSYDSGAPRILSAPIDPASGRILGEVRELWSGTGGLAPEAPHLYRRDGWWYLMLAEGGTAAGHAITMARAETLDGPWQPHPANPVFSHRGIDHPVQYTGHGDLVDTPDGGWAMVYLGVRLRGFPGFHVNGRESFIAARPGCRRGRRDRGRDAACPLPARRSPHLNGGRRRFHRTRRGCARVGRVDRGEPLLLPSRSTRDPCDPAGFRRGGIDVTTHLLIRQLIAGAWLQHLTASPREAS